MLILILPFVGCASKKFVAQEVEKSEVRTQTQVDELKTKVEETQTKIRDLAKDFDVKLDPIEKATQANAAQIEKLGEVRFQTTLSDEKALFEPDSFELTEAAKSELDQFANMIKAQNKFVFIEIQGHTDSLGTDKYNEYLGEHRAGAVRDYLYKQHDIPLHSISIISFGAAKPVADNKTREGRAANRRVVLVVRVKV
jgi:outer membrane protein OmpA-like peptidoglycan-associated protein